LWEKSCIYSINSLLGDNLRVDILFMLMPKQKKPRTTISFDLEDWEDLQIWAETEFRTVPQLCSALIKKSLIDWREQRKKESQE
jgi:hypothetical protein